MKSIKHILRVGNKEHDVEILSDSPGFLRSRFDGVTYEIFLAQEDVGDKLILVDGQPMRIRVETGRRGNHQFLVEGKQIEVSLQAGQIKTASRSDNAIPVSVIPRTGLRREAVVRAHMPGRIAGIRTTRSAQVKIGDPLFVLVAMKMENTIVAPVSGLVKEVQVELGATVNRGDALATIEERKSSAKDTLL